MKIIKFLNNAQRNPSIMRFAREKTQQKSIVFLTYEKKTSEDWNYLIVVHCLDLLVH